MRGRLSTSAGLTVVELAIGLVLVAGLALGCMEYYRAKANLADVRTALAQSRGELGVVMDDLARQLSQVKPGHTDSVCILTSARYDTLAIYLPEGADRVDTVRYFVNRHDQPPSLIKQLNRATPTVFARGIDTARFVPVGQAPFEQLSIVLVSIEPDPASPDGRFRLGETLPLGAAP